MIVEPGVPLALIDPGPRIRGAECGAAGPLVSFRGRPGLLACNHIVALNGRMPFGNPVGIRRADGTVAIAGSLAAFDRLDDRKDAVNLTDSALIALDADIELGFGFELLGPGEPVLYRIATPRLSGRVVKFGPSTGVTVGRIVAVDHSTVVHYPFGSYRLSAQILIEGEGRVPFAGKGDSGSLVYSCDPGRPRQPLGILWGGREVWAQASPLSACLDRLGAVLFDRDAREARRPAG